MKNNAPACNLKTTIKTKALTFRHKWRSWVWRCSPHHRHRGMAPWRQLFHDDVRHEWTIHDVTDRMFFQLRRPGKQGRYRWKWRCTFAQCKPRDHSIATSSSKRNWFVWHLIDPFECLASEKTKRVNVSWKCLPTRFGIVPFKFRNRQ